MTKPFVYVKISPMKYLICKYSGEVMYQYGSIVTSFGKWVFVPDTEEIPFLTGNETIRIGKKVVSLNKAKP